VDGADPHPEEDVRQNGVRAQRDLVTKITSARESKGGEVNRGIIGVIIGVLVIIILVIVILQLT
jgi:tetrahydromethanopterin S-methyltransferase subunit F